MRPMSGGLRAAALGGAKFSPRSLSPRLWFKFDDGSGTTPQDSSGNGRHGVFVNTPTWDAGPPVSLDFTGATADGVQIANDELGEPAAITVCAWLTVDVELGDIINVGEAVGFRLNDTIGFFYHYGAGNFRSGTAAFVASGSQHVALVIDPANSRQQIYVDAVSVATAAFSDAIVYNQGLHTYIGRNADGSIPYDGRMRQLLAFPSGLSATRIAQVMTATA